MPKKFLTGSSIITAFLSSLCCITPLLALVAGSSGMASAFSWLEPVRPYLVGLTVAVLGCAWYQKLKPQKQVTCDCEAGGRKSFWQSALFLGLVTIVSGLLITFPYYARIFYPKPQQINVVATGNNNMRQVEFSIKVMTCGGCEAHVNHELSKVKSIIEYKTSYEKAGCVIKFDGSKIETDSIAAIINKTGYKVVSQTETRN